jgi:sugar/nucleoside kinase (ribokinase family)
VPGPGQTNSPDVLIVGIAVVDAIARPVDQFPSPGGLRFFDELTFTTGGNAISCSIALTRLGVTADVVARVGTDLLGDFVVAELRRNGIAADGVVRDPRRSTSFSFVSVSANGERSFLHTTGANTTLEASDASALLLRGKRFVFVTGTMLMDTLDGDQTAGLLRAARTAGASTLMDTVYVESATREEWRRRVLPALPELDFFVPSEPEARGISGETDPAGMARVFRKLGARNVVIKLGERGVLCASASGRETLVPALRVPNVVDVTGAGDCWAAGFIAGLHAGKPMEEAARLGNAVAGVSIQGAGATTALKDMNQVMELLRGHD